MEKFSLAFSVPTEDVIVHKKRLNAHVHTNTYTHTHTQTGGDRLWQALFGSFAIYNEMLYFTSISFRLRDGCVWNRNTCDLLLQRFNTLFCAFKPIPQNSKTDTHRQMKMSVNVCRNLVCANSNILIHVLRNCYICPKPLGSKCFSICRWITQYKKNKCFKLTQFVNVLRLAQIPQIVIIYFFCRSFVMFLRDRMKEKWWIYLVILVNPLALSKIWHFFYLITNSVTQSPRIRVRVLDYPFFFCFSFLHLRINGLRQSTRLCSSFSGNFAPKTRIN